MPEPARLLLVIVWRELSLRLCARRKRALNTTTGTRLPCTLDSLPSPLPSCSPALKPGGRFFASAWRSGWFTAATSGSAR